MKTRQGDLIALALNGEFDVIVHGCNCYGQMGRGIALTIKTVFPEAYTADRATPVGDRTKLGSISCASISRSNQKITIVNAYTQFHWNEDENGGRNSALADYDAIRKAMQEIRHRFSGQRIAYPKIGAGLARGDWNIIAAIIEEELAGADHTYVEYIDPSSPQSI